MGLTELSKPTCHNFHTWLTGKDYKGHTWLVLKSIDRVTTLLEFITLLIFEYIYIKGAVSTVNIKLTCFGNSGSSLLEDTSFVGIEDRNFRVWNYQICRCIGPDVLSIKWLGRFVNSVHARLHSRK